MMHRATHNPSARIAQEVVALACRMVGRKRGLALAAEHLGVSERAARSIAYGESARPDPVRVAQARLNLARARAAQLRAELAQIEGLLDGETVDAPGAHLGAAR